MFQIYNLTAVLNERPSWEIIILFIQTWVGGQSFFLYLNIQYQYLVINMDFFISRTVTISTTYSNRDAQATIVVDVIWEMDVPANVALAQQALEWIRFTYANNVQIRLRHTIGCTYYLWLLCLCCSKQFT